ncbi:helix-turn-helix transcriptional regulator [bacterium]|nr:helix-turn-helix transcriptional regulator [bacterium]
MSVNIQKELGQKIRELRKIKGYSQEKFAERIDIATNTLSSIETGKAFMTAPTLEKILETLNITPAELFEFPQVKTQDEMYSFILNKLEFIKSDTDRLKIMYNLVKSLI